MVRARNERHYYRRARNQKTTVPTRDRCGKVLYTSEAQAIRAANRRIAKGQVYLRVYQCEYREGWHLTELTEEEHEAHVGKVRFSKHREH